MIAMAAQIADVPQIDDLDAWLEREQADAEAEGQFGTAVDQEVWDAMRGHSSGTSSPFSAPST